MRKEIYRRPPDPRLEGGRRIRKLLYPEDSNVPIDLSEGAAQDMQAYGRAVRASANTYSDTEIATALEAPKKVGMWLLEKFNLPRYERVTLSLDDFLKDQEEKLPKDKEADHFVLLERKKGGEKYRKKPLKGSEIINFIDEVVAKNDINVRDWDITIAETLPQEYGGNIIVNKDGKLLLEMGKGADAQGKVSDGTHDRDGKGNGDFFIVRRDVRSGHLEFLSENKEEVHGETSLREIIQQTINCLPHSGEGEKAKYAPGYFEFHIVRTRTGNLEPRFVDFRQDEALLNI